MPSLPHSQLPLAIAAVVAALAGVLAGSSAGAAPGPDRPATREPTQQATAAAGAHTRKPVIFDLGPFALSVPARDRTLDEIAKLGVDTVRVMIHWKYVAPARPPPGFNPADPASPGYAFSSHDAFLKAVKAHGLRVLLTPSGPAPAWAGSPAGAEVADPDPEQFGRFVEAVAARYSGHFRPPRPRPLWLNPVPPPPLPKADLWSVWNEPNLRGFLEPQFRDGRPYSPLLYRRLYLAARAAIARKIPGATVLIGETSPNAGTPNSLDPETFARGVLCLDQAPAGAPECGRRLEAAGWAHHPYPTGDAVSPFEISRQPGAVTFGTLWRLENLLDRAAGAGQIAARLPVYITEYGQVNNPVLKVPLRRQAEYLALAQRVAQTDRRIASFAQYLMEDDPAFASGLRFADGKEKPSFAAFRTPLAVLRRGDRVRIWGLVRPARGATTVILRSRDRRGRARHLARLRTSRAGIFRLRSDFVAGRRWQLVWPDGNGHSLPGPWTRAYQAPAGEER